jgi:ribosomal-protein-alanine N-acetyltransferase
MWRWLNEQMVRPATPYRKLYPLPPLDLCLAGPNVALRMGDPSDWKDWRNLRDQSRHHLMPWEPTWPHNALAYGYFCGLLRRQWREWREGTAYNFLIFRVDDEERMGALLGGITLNGIERGIAQKGTLGYWMGEPYTGHGFMSEAVGLVCDFAFDTLRLNRVEASCLPRNAPSKHLLQKLGFAEEGYARSYLQINGAWEDHLLWGKTR